VTRRVVFYDIEPHPRWALAARMALGAWERKKVLILRCHPEEIEALDQHLWTFRDEVFLPHESWWPGKTLLDAEARILLVASDELPRDGEPGEARDILLQLAPVPHAVARRFETVIDVVDHGDDVRLAASRARYKAWVDDGLRPEIKKAP
jgi:DNA polymerase IIIc chi subunit